MIDYQSFQYIYPPRPKNAVPNSDLKMWDNGSMIGQPKINGSNCTIYMNGKDVYTFNRHGQRMSNFDIKSEEILSLYKGKGWMVLNGEYTNKARVDHNNQLLQNKFCLFDILVYDSKYLIGETFEKRIDLMLDMYGDGDSYINQFSDNFYLIKTYHNNFYNLYDSLTKIDLVEGLVLKRKNAKLEVGTSENNNSKSQIKARKPTKNYKF
jgi:hypothetical protein